MWRNCLCFVVLTLLVCGELRDSQAGLVQIDDFSLSSAPSTLDVNGWEVIRTVNGGEYNHAFQSWSLNGPGVLTVNYTVVGGSFADLFGSDFNGFVLNISRNGSGSTIAVADTNLGQTSGPIAIVTPSVRTDFGFGGFDGATSAVTFTFTQTGRPGAKLNLNAFSAVPEPSALLLVGSVLTLAAARRRRISQ